MKIANCLLGSIKANSLAISKVMMVIAIIFMSLFGSASGQGTSGLLGVMPGFPQVDATGTNGQQGCLYDSNSMTLTINATPNLYFPNADSLLFISDGLLVLTANLDPSGNVLGGTLVVNGTAPGFADPLLIGDVTAVGLEDSNPTPGGTDRGDAFVVQTGGSLPIGPDVLATLTMEASTYAGNLAGDWVCNRAKLIVGAAEEGVIGVDIDIKPGSDPNSINPRSNGVVPVAILGSMDFDALQVIASTVRFGPGQASPAHSGHVENVNNDGFPDFVVHFPTQDTGIVCGDTEATLTGETTTDSFTGTDSIKTSGCNAKKAASTIEVLPASSASALNPWVLFGLVAVAFLRRRQ